MFGAPTHRLTARAPHQASPEAWLDAADSFVYSSGLIDFVFRSVTLGGGIIVLDPGPLA